MTKPRATSSRQPHPVDRSVGLNIRNARRARRLSQEALADAIGITFQQLQKYEHGTNRVSCSRLVEIANVLGIQPALLLPEMSGASEVPMASRLQSRLMIMLERLSPRQARILLLTASAMAPRRRG